MTLARWQATITDDEGNVRPGASITVRRELIGAALAGLYSDRAGATPLGNPFNADAEGFAAFHVSGGAYRITATSGSFSREWRYVAIGTAAELDTIEGASLVQDVATGYGLTFETATSAPPSAGCIRFNNANLSLATSAYVSAINAAGSDITERLLELYDAARGVKDTFQISNPETNVAASFRITGATPVGSPVDYVTFTIANHAGETSFPASEPLSFQPNRAGVDGAPGGDGLMAAASVAEVRGASVGDEAITPEHLETAAATVALTDAAPVAVNWDSGINFTLTVTANRAIGNPTNGQPGTWRTILVQGNDGTDRTITFGNQYGGTLPTITDCDSTKKYLLVIFCKTSTQFLVFANNGSDA